MTGTIWSICSWGTSRALTYALEPKWDLKRCRQKKDESLRDFIRCYSKRCTELPEVSESDVIGIFLEVTTCDSLIHKLGQKRPSIVG